MILALLLLLRTVTFAFDHDGIGVNRYEVFVNGDEAPAVVSQIAAGVLEFKLLMTTGWPKVQVVVRACGAALDSCKASEPLEVCIECVDVTPPVVQ